MQPLHVDIFSPPSSSQPSTEHNETKVNKCDYEEVDYTEIIFPDFKHLKRLGRGSYGTVVQCYFRGRVAAAKLLESNADHVHIHNEAKLLHEFKHENIIELYAAFHGEQSGLVLELMEGGSLHELLHQKKHISYQACHVLGWALQVTSALSYLHSRGYVHRDLKPSNMLLTYDYVTLKLCDFGTVAELKTSMTNNRGSAAWMAPEVFRGKKYDQKCDIFSFGILMWEMITRRQPFDNWNSNPYTILWQVSEGRRPTMISNCPDPLTDLINRCWSDNPKERPYIAEVAAIIEVLCEIFPNRFLPLIDRTTKKQALEERSINYYVPRYRPPQPLLQMPPSNQTTNYLPQQHPPQTRSPIPPPIPPPPFSNNITYNDNSYNPQQQTINFALSAPCISQPTSYNPNLGTNAYNSYSTPQPNSRPYFPCRNSDAPLPPPLFTQMSAQSNSSGNSGISVSSYSSNDTWGRHANNPTDSPHVKKKKWFSRNKLFKKS